MARNTDWGISLSTDPPTHLNWSATGDLFFAMSEYFEPPEREEYLVPRSELEKYIRAEQAMLPREIEEDDDEWINLFEFLDISKQENFWLYAWW